MLLMVQEVGMIGVIAVAIRLRLVIPVITVTVLYVHDRFNLYLQITLQVNLFSEYFDNKLF